MMKFRCLRLTRALSSCVLVAVSCLCGCTSSSGTELHGQVRMTFLHTSDIHSRLFPYALQIGQIDAKLGLGEIDTIADVGGAARISHVIGRERARSARVMHVDTGDVFQGAPVFNFFNGEAEFKTLAALGIDATVIGNHEFDKGVVNLTNQLRNNGNFPALVANYMMEDPAWPSASPLGTVTQPYMVFDVDGLRVGLIGMGSLSSITSIYEMPNNLGILPLKTTETAQMYVDLLRPFVDLVVVLSHMGLHKDEEMAEGTSGIDVIFGGHNHIVLQPPKRLRDCAKVDEQGRHYIEIVGPDPQDPDEASVKVRRYCTPRNVILAHSGAFAKYVGRLDLVVSDDPNDFDPGFLYDPVNGFEVVSNNYELFAINETVPEDPTVSAVLEQYSQGLDLTTDLDLLVGYAPAGSPRNAANGGDSPLGNLISQAMWLRMGVQTDFSMTNTTGIRADVVPGVITAEQMFNIFPFDNSITKMQLSGKEVQELMDYVARRSTGRGCVSQVQIAGMRLVIDCVAQSEDPNLPPGRATHIFIGTTPGATCTEQGGDADCPGGEFGSCDPNTWRCWQPIDKIASYEMATSNYLANGGSGYSMLERNTTQFDTKIQQRDALIDYFRDGKPCGANDAGELTPCAVDADCADLPGNFVCACPDTAVEGEVCLTNTDPATGAVSCPKAAGAPGPGEGACVLAECRNDAAKFKRSTCDRLPVGMNHDTCLEQRRPCATGGEVCKFLACVNEDMGNASDGRVRMVGK